MTRLLIILLFSLLLPIKDNNWELILFLNGEKVSDFNRATKYSNLTDGFIERYYIDTTVVYCSNGIYGIAKHVNKGFSSVYNLPIDFDYSKYKSHDTVALIISYDLKEKGILNSSKKTGVWTFYADPFDADTIRTFYYTLGFKNDSIVGPYFLFNKNDTLLKAFRLDNNLWKIMNKSKIDTINSNIFRSSFLLDKFDGVRLINYYRKK